VDIFWQFVESNDLSEWEPSDGKGGPLCDYVEGSTLLPSDSEFNRMPQFFDKWFRILLIWAEGSLWRDGRLQPGTYDYTVKALNLALEHGFSIHRLSHFSNRSSRSFMAGKSRSRLFSGIQLLVDTMSRAIAF